MAPRQGYSPYRYSPIAFFLLPYKVDVVCTRLSKCCVVILYLSRVVVFMVVCGFGIDCLLILLFIIKLITSDSA